MNVKSTNTTDLDMLEHHDTNASHSMGSISDDVTQHHVYQHFAKSGDMYSSETEALGGAIRAILAQRGKVTNKDIILHLIMQLETTNDVVQLDILRNALELVVGITPDDAVF